MTAGSGFASPPAGPSRRAWGLALLAFTGALAASAGLTARPGQVPAPASVLGFPPCADRSLATYEEVERYFRRLDAASDRVAVFDIGDTVEGRRQVLAAISSEANLRDLERFRRISARLARARESDGEARVLAREGRAVVWIDFGLHSNELAPAQAAPLLAYRVATEESGEMRAVRDGVILLLVPNMNPDGTTLWAEWYRRHVGTPFEGSPPPVLYHRYAGHDNNRDWFMFTQPESRNVARQLYHVWLPQIVYDHHQEAPFPARIFIPPFDDPMNPHIPPLVMRGVAAVGEAMGRRFAREGKAGVISRIGYDAWWNGGMRSAPAFHNMIGLLTETAHTSPAPASYHAGRFPRTFANGVSTREPSVTYPSPYLGGTWRLRDSCDYLVTASLAALEMGAKHRAEWLYDIHRMGRDAIAAGETETYLISADQWDRGAAHAMVDALRIGGIDVERARVAFEVDRTVYPAGSFVIRGAQAFRPYLTDLLNPQHYPEGRPAAGGAPAKPYDTAGWTLPVQMGVRVERVAGRLDVETTPVDRAGVPPVPAPGREAAGDYAIDPRSNAAFRIVNRLLETGAPLCRATTPVATSGGVWPPGTFVVPFTPEAERIVPSSAVALGAPVSRVAAGCALAFADDGTRRRDGDRVGLRRPRIGLYQAWGGNIDEGWTRWVLEQHEFTFEVLHDADIRAGDLGDRVDVIVLPDASDESMRTGLAPGTVPPEYAGGMSASGIAHLRAFVVEGGTLVALDSAAQLPVALFQLPVQDVVAARAEHDVLVPGSLLRLRLDRAHPLAYGMPDEAAAVVTRSPAFHVAMTRDEARGDDAPRGADGRAPSVAARYASAGLLLSGFLSGEAVLAGRAAVVDLPVERGRVVLLGFRVQHRGQPHGTFKLLFNALLLPHGPRLVPGTR